MIAVCGEISWICRETTRRRRAVDSWSLNNSKRDVRRLTVLMISLCGRWSSELDMSEATRRLRATDPGEWEVLRVLRCLWVQRIVLCHRCWPSRACAEARCREAARKRRMAGSWHRKSSRRRSQWNTSDMQSRWGFGASRTREGPWIVWWALPSSPAPHFRSWSWPCLAQAAVSPPPAPAATTLSTLSATACRTSSTLGSSAWSSSRTRLTAVPFR